MLDGSRSLDRVRFARFDPLTRVVTHRSPQTRFQAHPVGVAQATKTHQRTPLSHGGAIYEESVSLEE
jgi:hypothetical protein